MVISDHLIQFLIQSTLTNAKLEQACKLQICYKNFDKINLKMTYTKSAGKNTSNSDSNVALEHFLQINF